MTPAEMNEAIERIGQLIKQLNWKQRVYALDHMADFLGKDGLFDTYPALKAEVAACRLHMVQKAMKEAA